MSDFLVRFVCKTCRQEIKRGDELFVWQSSRGFTGPFCDSDCMRKHYDARDMAAAIGAIRGCRGES